MPKTTASNRKPLFWELARDIDWQRASFLFHCLEIVRPSNSPKVTSDIHSEIVVRKILDDYLLLALLFYRQFKADLSNRYNASDSTLQEVDVKTSLQRGLEKLIAEWHRVYAIILAIRAGTSNVTTKKILKKLHPVLKSALNDLYLPGFSVILQFGESYSLRFSNYTDGIAALSVPTMALESPWEWTILWHELGGEKVRMLKNEKPDFFASKINRVMDQLNEDEKATAQEFGWSVGWFEELFEDSFSIINFPIHFLYVFKNLLERFPDGGKGNRHPLRSVRLAVAMSLHLQMVGFKSLPDLDTWNDATWLENWRELKEEYPLLPSRFSEFDPAHLLPDPVQSKIAWLTAGEILRWHNSQSKPSSRVQARIRDVIDDAIKGYSTFSFSEKGDRAKIFETFRTNIRKLTGGAAKPVKVKYTQSQLLVAEVEDVVRSKVYSKENNKILDDLEKAPENLKIKKLLRGGESKNTVNLTYEEMLGIPFDDVDYLMTHVKEVKFNEQIQYMNFTVFRLIDNFEVGTVTYTKDNDPTVYRTTPIAWNEASPERKLPRQ
jgi:hypothetical protein